MAAKNGYERLKVRYTALEQQNTELRGQLDQQGKLITALNEHILDKENVIVELKQYMGGLRRWFWERKHGER